MCKYPNEHVGAYATIPKKYIPLNRNTKNLAYKLFASSLFIELLIGTYTQNVIYVRRLNFNCVLFTFFWLYHRIRILLILR